jgi:hypothetical protein
MVASPLGPVQPPTPWQLDDVTLLRLANELARNIYPIEDTLSRFGLSVFVFQKFIRPNATFERYFREAHALWTASANATERIQVKAQVLFEEWMSEADRLFHAETQPLSGKVDLFKTVSRIAGLEQGKDGKTVQPGERVVVQINLGAAGQPAPIIIDKLAPPIIDVTHAD